MATVLIPETSVRTAPHRDPVAPNKILISVTFLPEVWHWPNVIGALLTLFQRTGTSELCWVPRVAWRKRSGPIGWLWNIAAIWQTFIITC